MRNLEQFIKDNRDAFDSYEPSQSIWETLQEQFPEPGKKKTILRKMIWKRWAVAAAVLLVLGSGTAYLLQSNNHRTDAAGIVTKDIPDEYAAEVYHFTRLIELKHKELNKLKKDEPELYSKFSGDLRRLDSSYQMLKNELPGNPDEEVVLAAMMENLRIQTELLNQQLTIIKKIKQNKKGNNEKLYKSI